MAKQIRPTLIQIPRPLWYALEEKLSNGTGRIPKGKLSATINQLIKDFLDEQS